MAYKPPATRAADESAKAPGSSALATEQIERYEELRAERDSKFMVTWQYISQYFLPQDSDINISKTEGTTVNWTDRIFDTTPIECAETLRSGQYTWLTPPSQPWAEFDVPEDLAATQDEEATDDGKNFYGKASDTSMKELARSNFYSTAGSGYLGVGVFGTDLIILEEGTKRSLLNFIHVKIGTYVIEEDSDGIVDTMRRKFSMTYRQAEQKFNKPGDRLPEDMKRAAQGAEGKTKKFDFLHCIFPREDSDRLPGRKDGANKPVASVYIAMEFKACVRVAGYEENPILCQRFDKWGEDSPWGYGPAYLGLPNARQLNYVQQYMDSLAELHADPRVLVPDNLEGDVDLRAGGVTTFDSATPNAKPEEWMSVGDYKLGMELQEQKREALRNMFFVPAFKLLNSQPLLDRKDMTAYEISQRQAEQLAGFTPAFARRINEFMNPLMLRVFGILYRAGKFGAAPDSLMVQSGTERGLALPNVLITSRISDALKALKNRGTEETMQFMLPIAEAGHPEIFDILKLENTGKEYARNTGMSPDLIRSDRDIQKLREAQAQIQAQQRTAMLAESLSKTAANMGKAPEPMQQNMAQGAAA